MPFRHHFCLFATLMTVALPCTALAEGKSIIVLDASGSMWGQIDGRPKLEIAREALASVLTGLPDDTELGLMAYGHREKGSCTDIELIVPPGPGTAAMITAAARDMKFLGKTPLSEAVRQAAGDLRFTEEKATVILITDGIETCEADPCALGAELEASGVDFTTHVVGFGLTADEGRQVACLAENTGGKYIEASDAGALVEALKTTVAAAPVLVPALAPAPAPEPVKPAEVEFTLTGGSYWAEGGDLMTEDDGASIEVFTKNSDGTAGDSVRQQYSVQPMKIPPGDYILRAERDAAEAETSVTVTADKMTTANVVLNAAKVTVRPLTEEGGDPVNGAGVDFEGMGISPGHYGVSTRILPAGTYTVTVRIGKANTEQQIEVKAGVHQTLDVVVGVGIGVIDTWYTSDLIMEDIGQGVDIYEAKTALDGSRTSVGGSYGAAQEFSLPPGDYVAEVRKDVASAEVLFTVKANERVMVKAVLNAGALGVAAPGARYIEVFGAKVDLSGKRKSFRSDYGEEMSLIFPPGDYVVEAEVDGVILSKPASILAGERTDITIP